MWFVKFYDPEPSLASLGRLRELARKEKEDAKNECRAPFSWTLKNYADAVRKREQVQKLRTVMEEWNNET